MARTRGALSQGHGRHRPTTSLSKGDHHKEGSKKAREALEEEVGVNAEQTLQQQAGRAESFDAHAVQFWCSML
ncbi:hypothetical protein VNO80_19463 [Phaseolus coccineus]|uniref:Uncharacterized protein n=1 Tax=Phaseolus coccineus TaxID=3886 RepID=A0AAN9ML88_PHACN